MNFSQRLLIASLLISAVLSSCSYQSQVIRLHPAPPQVNAAETSTGEREVVLVTRDARSSQEIGRRGDGSRDNATITTDTDIAALMQEQMTDILKARGYRVLPQERRVVMEPIAKSNEEWINEAFADAFKEVANDSVLYAHVDGTVSGT